MANAYSYERFSTPEASGPWPERQQPAASKTAPSSATASAGPPGMAPATSDWAVLIVEDMGRLSRLPPGHALARLRAVVTGTRDED